MNANDLLRAGRLTEAIQAVTEEVRQAPGNAQKRTFLFELLCFAGEHDRAERQLDALSNDNKNVQMGALLYRAALAAERVRQKFFQAGDYKNHPAASDQVAGSLNSAVFQTITDADPRIGARLEVLAGGDYLWIPFEQIASITMQAPKRLRDLLWAPVLLQTGPECKHRDMGEVLVPVLYPGSSRHEDESVRLGRATTWEEQEPGSPSRAGFARDGVEVGAELPFGQKLFLVDGEEVPFLEIRELIFAKANAAAS